MVIAIHTFSCTTAIMLIIYCQKYLIRRLAHLKMWVVWIPALLAGIVGGYIDTLIVKDGQVSNVGTFPIKLLFPLCILLIFEGGSLSRRLGDYILSMLLYMVTEVFCIMAEVFILSAVFGSNNMDLRFILISGFVYLLTLVVIWQVNKNRNNRIMLTAREKIMIFIVNIFTCILLNGATQDFSITSNVSKEFSITFLGYSAIFLYTFFIISLVNGRLAAYFKEAELVSQRYMGEQLRYFQSYKLTQEENRRLHHDMKNHILYMQALSKENNYTELQSYLLSLNDKCEELPQLFSTGNDVVDTIINVKNFMYEEHRIQVSVNGRFTTTIKMKPIDLCTILSNALDNAINANAGLSATITRFIEIDIMANRNYYLLTLKNPVEKQVEVENNQIVNSVGNGMGNIVKTIKTYGGYIKINSMPDIFTLEIVFPR